MLRTQYFDIAFWPVYGGIYKSLCNSQMTFFPSRVCEVGIIYVLTRAPILSFRIKCIWSNACLQRPKTVTLKATETKEQRINRREYFATPTLTDGSCILQRPGRHLDRFHGNVWKSFDFMFSLTFASCKSAHESKAAFECFLVICEYVAPPRML